MSGAGVGRRTFLGVGAGAGLAAAGAVAGVGAERASHDDAAPAASAEILPVAFHGEHQAGITTAAQDRLHYVALDVVTDSREVLVALLKTWTAAARQMTQGYEVGEYGAVAGPDAAPPEDTGEALGLPASQLTVTIGFGPSLFADASGAPRFGLGGRRPEALADLPRFAGDDLDPELCGGDLVIQACANDPQVCVHAIRNLVRLGAGLVRVRYSQLGFGRTSSTSTAQATPRNLFGYKDGTANIKSEDTGVVDRWVWAGEGDDPTADWMVGGSYLVHRKIMMRIESWDSESLIGQDTIIGREKGSGGPMSGGDEFVPPDFEARGADGEPLIDKRAHVRLTHPSNHGGAQLLRRGYNFVDGSDRLGRLAAGLFFICFQRDPRTQYVPIQTAIAGPFKDALSEYLVHVGSGVFACPPGVSPGGYWGDTLFET